MNKERIKKGKSQHLDLKRKLRSDATLAEHKLWFFLKAKKLGGFKFRRQHGIGPYIVDFYCSEKRMVIEIDGDIHALPENIKKDYLRTGYLKKLGLQVLRYTNEDVLNNIEALLEHLHSHLVDQTSTSP